MLLLLPWRPYRGGRRRARGERGAERKSEFVVCGQVSFLCACAGMPDADAGLQDGLECESTPSLSLCVFGLGEGAGSWEEWREKKGGERGKATEVCADWTRP